MNLPAITPRILFPPMPSHRPTEPRQGFKKSADKVITRKIGRPVTAGCCGALDGLTIGFGNEPALCQSVGGEEAGAQDQDQQGGKPISVGRYSVEVAGIEENMGEVGAVIGHAQVGHDHVEEKTQRS